MTIKNSLINFRNMFSKKAEDNIEYDPETTIFKGKRWPVYLMAFIIPAVIMLLVYAAMKVFPFGNGAVLVLDLNGQYVYFFEELRNKILNGGSLIYSWGRALGGEFMGIFAYYIASPFSFLVALFPKANITEALLVIFLLKTGCCGLTMSIYLDKKKKTNSLNNVIFSCLYALCSYAVVYMHNTMWIDEMIFLPLLVFGIEKLIKERSPSLYCASLAFCLMSNFYIGYMMCIFTILYFFYFYIANDEKDINYYNERYHFLKSFLRILLYSLIGIAIACIIILPAYVGLQFGKSTFTEPNYVFQQKFDFLDMIAKLYPGVYDSVTPSGLPWIYCGTLTIILLPLYFISKKISVREKLATFGLICALVISFNGSTIDIVWHGFQKPNWLNYRYSFALIFIMIVCAYKVFCNLEEFSFKYILGSSLALAILLLIIQKQDYKWLEDLRAVWLSLACLAIFSLALYPVSKQFLHKQIRAVILIIVCLELFCSGLVYNLALDREVVFSSRVAYRNYMDKYQPVVDSIKEYDKNTFNSPFYRMDKTNYKKTNDNMALGYYGVSLSSSMLNQSVIDMLAHMGYLSMSHWSKYPGGTPVSDSLLGIKYVIDDDSDASLLLREKIYSDDDKSLYGYYNPYNIQIGSAVSQNITNFQPENYTMPFEYLNALITKMVGSDTTIQLFKPLEYNTNEENLEISFSGGNRKYSKVSSSKEGKINFTLNSVGNNEIFCFFPCSYKKEVSLLLNGDSFGSYFVNDSYCILSLGEYADNEDIILSMTLEEDYVYMAANANFFYYLDTELFKEIMPQIKENSLEITHFKDTEIEGKINVTNEKNFVYTSIPFDSGWQVYVDNQKVETTRVVEALTGFYINPGEHNIKMVYRPNCVVYGLIISALGLISLLIYHFVRKKIYYVPSPIEKDDDDDLDIIIEQISADITEDKKELNE